ncbi:uncharacterized protein TEOVI_000682700 [Trypanosoma equiperdum]|uniref:Uncharacterized protein n=2 Tax=Trypanozoon TaxID=39700 RepID=A0A1G4I131_TRYEQ|nr:hypothetical protein DPX39_020022200 [Trypanosoma brucei equiperdum]SCU65368.1 hypothetical protein, conserved [Trypanosoma equiperdum]
MSGDGSDGWGEMVLPGVFMLRRSAALPRKLIGPVSDGDKMEIIAYKIEEIEKYIQKLKESNANINEFLNDEGRNSGTRHQTLSSNDISTLNADGDDRVLLEALAENAALISSKTRELEELKALLQNNCCACACRSYSSTDGGSGVQEPSVTHFTGDEEESSVNDMSIARFSL